MTSAEGQVPLRQVLEFQAAEKGRYDVFLPRSACFGTVAAGGLVMACVHRAAADTITQGASHAAHKNVLNISCQFYRPTLPTPQHTSISIRVANSAKKLTTLHFEVSQNNKACVAGYITMTDLAAPGNVSAQTGWALSPAPAPVSIADLEADRDSEWVGYLTPYSPQSMRQAQSYMKYFVPKHRHWLYETDQWVTPGWSDDESSSGAVWTNELVHFVVDNSVPVLGELINDNIQGSLYGAVVAAAQEQRKARLEGRDDRIVGRGLRDHELGAYIISTISITTEIKKLLPPQGVKWLFMRTTTKALLNDRMDITAVLIDEGGDIVAQSQQLTQIVPVGKKNAQKPSL